MPTNRQLNVAKAEKKDEFYTQYEDIEKEVAYHKNSFKNKVVFCNCDDPEWSNFWRYFHEHFNELGLKQLICTHYEYDKQSYMLEYNGENDKEISVGIKRPLEGNGDFRSDECIALLDKSDIVVTNPPFSLIKEYLPLLIKHKKKYLIMARQTALTYPVIFDEVLENRLKWGESITSGDRLFRVNDDYPLTTKNYKVDEKGIKYIKVTGIRWYTNLDLNKRPNTLQLTYIGKINFPKYIDSNIIDIGKFDSKGHWKGDTSLIPKDYKGVMGVPITFFDKYNPKDYKIVGKVDTGKVTKINIAQPILSNGLQVYKKLAIRKV